MRNQLTGVSVTGFTASFTYDSFGRRTSKTINGTTTNFVYDGLNPVQEQSGGSVTANLLTGLGIDEFFTRTDGSGNRALLPDALGSTLALGDGTGTLQTQYTYEPFGYATTSGSANANSYKYTGREDDGSGFYYYRTRYYHPRLQRFISEDPLGFSTNQDGNFYNYSADSPINFNDPLGLEAGCPGCVQNCLSANYGNLATYAYNASVYGVLTTAGMVITATSVGIKLGVGGGIGGTAQAVAHSFATKSTSILSTPASAFGSIFGYQVRASLAASAAQTSATFSGIANMTYAALKQLSIAGTLATAGATGFYTGAQGYCRFMCRGK